MSTGRDLIRPVFWLLCAGVATAVGAALAHRWLDVVEVRGRSMTPTLLPGDRLFVARMSRAARAGDLVLAADPRGASRELVKRVVATQDGSLTLGGDNPAWSTDSRSFGTVPADAVSWRAVVRYWPASRIGPIAGPR